MLQSEKRNIFLNGISALEEICRKALEKHWVVHFELFSHAGQKLSRNQVIYRLQNIIHGGCGG